jgi:hypothetical protein
MKKRHVVIAPFLLALAFVFDVHLEAAAIAKPVATPIIAELFASPKAYDGRLVAVYGLVIEEGDRGEFVVQDVSQMPLSVITKKGRTPAIGDQLLIHGVFRYDREVPYLEARTVVPTKVLGGGGCC